MVLHLCEVVSLLLWHAVQIRAVLFVVFLFISVFLCNPKGPSAQLWVTNLLWQHVLLDIIMPSARARLIKRPHQACMD